MTQTNETSQAPDVAVIVTAYNRVDFLPETLDSLVNQQFDGRMEIVVVDDGSTVDIRPAVQPFLDRFADPGASVQVRYLRQENMGLAEARNTGVRNTTAPFIAFVDDDDICEPTKIQQQVDVLRSDEELGLVHTSFRYVDKAGQFVDDGPQRVDNPCRGRCVDVLLNELLVVSSTVMVRRSRLDQIATAEPHGKPYDPKWVRSQDYDMTLRMARVAPLAYIEQPLLRYRLHDGNIAMTEGNIKRAYGYHCRVQMDFARRWGHEFGVDEAEAKRRSANFLLGRAESNFWQRKLNIARQLCDLARELGVSDQRFTAIEHKAARPAWMYKAKDAVDRLVGRAR